jgi:hypothetical protein
MRARDTTPAAAAIQEEIYRRLGPAGRFRIAMELSDFTRSLTEAGIRHRHPELTPEEVKRMLVKVLYGVSEPQ